MSDGAELHRKVLGFLSGALAPKEGGRQCIGIDLLYSPGSGYKDEDIRKWVRADEPELFENLVNVEKLVLLIIEIAEDEANAKTAGKHRFIVRSREHMGGRALLSFALQPSYSGGGDETALALPGGIPRDAAGVALSTINSHAGQLMRINQQMHEGTIRVLAAQNEGIRTENAELRAENIALRREVDEARSNKMDREFQIAMAAEKNQRTNAGIQKLLQIGTIVASKIAGGNDDQNGAATPLAMLLTEFGKSLRSDQIGAVMGVLDMSQKMMFMEIMKIVMPPDEPKPSQGPASLGAPAP